jgi:hypothetical protein
VTLCHGRATIVSALESVNGRGELDVGLDGVWYARFMFVDPNTHARWQDRWGISALIALFAAQLAALAIGALGLVYWALTDLRDLVSIVDWQGALLLWGSLAVFNGAIWICGRWRR